VRHNRKPTQSKEWKLLPGKKKKLIERKAFLGTEERSTGKGKI